MLKSKLKRKSKRMQPLKPEDLEDMNSSLAASPEAAADSEKIPPLPLSVAQGKLEHSSGMGWTLAKPDIEVLIQASTISVVPPSGVLVSQGSLNERFFLITRGTTIVKRQG